MLGHIQSESNHWRLRKLLASQLKDWVELFEPRVVYRIHFPIAFKLCKDDVAEVRTQACWNIPAILKNLKQEKNKNYFEKVKKEIFKLGESTNYTQRQIFVAICANVLNEDLSLFCKYFIDKFLEKQSDRIVNVRIVMAKYCGQFLSNFVDPEIHETSSVQSDHTEEEKIEPVESNIQKNKKRYEKLLHDKKFMRTIIRLKNDEKADVGNNILNSVNFDKLMEFIKMNEHNMNDVDLYDDLSDTSEPDYEATDDNTELVDDEETGASLGIWSLYTARGILDEVILSTDDEESEGDQE